MRSAWASGAATSPSTRWVRRTEKSDLAVGEKKLWNSMPPPRYYFLYQIWDQPLKKKKKSNPGPGASSIVYLSRVDTVAPSIGIGLARPHIQCTYSRPAWMHARSRGLLPAYYFAALSSQLDLLNQTTFLGSPWAMACAPLRKSSFSTPFF